MRSDTITMERELAEAEAALVYLRDKAVAFEVLSERVASGAWTINADSDGAEICRRGCNAITAPTLAEAVRLAMEAEGER